MAADVGGAIKTGPSPWQPIYNEFKMQHGTKKKKYKHKFTKMFYPN